MCEMNNVEMNYFCALFSVPASQLTTVLLGDLNGSDMNQFGSFQTPPHWISAVPQ